MHSPIPQPDETAQHHDAAPGDAAAQECLLYLFGELDSARSLSFEQSLETDAELRQQFIQQAQLVALLGESAVPCGPQVSTRSSLTASPVKRRGRSIGWVAATAAIAATLLLVSWLARPDGESARTTFVQRGQTQRLADAWWLSYGAVAESHVLEDRQAAEVAEAELMELEADPVETDELSAPPEWMIAALSALDPDDRGAGEVSDG